MSTKILEKSNLKMMLVINRIMSSADISIDLSEESLEKDFSEMEEAGMLSQLILNESAFNNKLIVDIYDIDFEFTPHTRQLVEDYNFKLYLETNEEIGNKQLLIRLMEENRLKELFLK